MTGTPPLTPKFRSSTPDYTVHCDRPVRLAIAPPTHTRVSVDGGRRRSKPFTATAKLAPGQAAALRFVRGSGGRTYRVRCLPADFPPWRVWLAGRRQARWYLITPNIKEGGGYAIVVDSRGVPVWWLRQRPAPFDLDLMPNGHLSWTSYVALSPNADHFGEWTLDGRELRSFGTVGASTNQHDFRLLPNGDALMITYRPRYDTDLSAYGGPRHAIVLDGEIQEVDPQGNLVWSWNTKDHIPLSAGERWLRRQIKKPSVHTYDGKPVYDLVHMNSIEPDGRRIVFSARYLEAVYAIDRSTGKVAWKLGGTHGPQSLRIDGDPDRRADFGGQHDARLLDHGRFLTFFDNGTLRERPPRAVEFRLDLKHRRARLVQDVAFPDATLSTCCGGTRRLPGGDWVVSWGNNPWITEQRPSGRPVFRLEFLGRYASYRAIPVLPGQLSRGALARGMRAIWGGGY